METWALRQTKFRDQIPTQSDRVVGFPLFQIRSQAAWAYLQLI